jgi:hypothetical protein
MPAGECSWNGPRPHSESVQYGLGLRSQLPRDLGIFQDQSLTTLKQVLQCTSERPRVTGLDGNPELLLQIFHHLIPCASLPARTPADRLIFNLGVNLQGHEDRPR